MELENIVANTVLLKAREGKLTHEGAEIADCIGLLLSVCRNDGNGGSDDRGR